MGDLDLLAFEVVVFAGICLILTGTIPNIKSSSERPDIR